MTSNFLKYTVIFLAVLIFICFALLLYGLYSKISNTEVLISEEISSYSLNLTNTEIIKNVRINNENDNEKLSKIYLVKNIQNLRSYIRRVID